MLGAVLLSTINLAYYQELMAGMRAAIAAGRFADFRADDAMARLAQQGDELADHRCDGRGVSAQFVVGPASLSAASATAMRAEA